MNSYSPKYRKIWIGLIGVSPDSEKSIIEDDKCAYVTVVARALDEIDFRTAVTRECAKNGLSVHEISEIQRLDRRLEQYVVGDELLEKANALHNIGDVGFGVFHSYPKNATE